MRNGEPVPDPATGRFDGRELGAWRASLGVTQQEVADSMDVKRPYIARLEHETVSRRAGEKVIESVRRRAYYRSRMQVNGINALATIRAERER